jgi:hypothetical protein
MPEMPTLRGKLNRSASLALVLVGLGAGCGDDDGATGSSAGGEDGEATSSGGLAGPGAGAGDAASGAGGSGPAGSAGSGAGAGGGTVDPGSCDDLRELASDHGALLAYLAGPTFDDLHDEPGDTPAEIFDRGNAGAYCFGDCTAPVVDWAGYAGQVVFAPSAAGSAAMSRPRFDWSKHTGHGGAEFAHLYQLAPVGAPDDADSDSWFTSEVDPGLDAWAEGSALPEPVAVARGRVTWSNHGIVVFRDGLIGAVGSGNSSDTFPSARLAAGKVPTDVAVTGNSEFALVTVWDTEACKSEVAVLALTQRDGYLPGLPSEGFFGAIKLLGYVELPIAAPTRISASVDFGLWMSSASRDAQAELATQDGRDRWAASADEPHSAARAGYALIASRDEDAVVVLDLEPLLQFYRSMYMTTQERFDQTTDVGDDDDQWPFTFAFAPDAAPIVAEVLDIDAPSIVVTGHPVGDRSFTDGEFARKAYVGSVGGELAVYDTGGVATEGPATSLAEIGVLETCLNPSRVFYGRGGASRDGLVIACRGDRKIHFVDGGGSSTRFLEDSRLLDPTDVIVGETRGAAVASIADGASGTVHNYLVAPIDAWGEPLFGGLGEDGEADFEHTGSLSVDGTPFRLSSAQVP